MNQDELIELLDERHPEWDSRFMTPEAAACYYEIENTPPARDDYAELDFSE